MDKLLKEQEVRLECLKLAMMYVSNGIEVDVFSMSETFYKYVMDKNIPE